LCRYDVQRRCAFEKHSGDRERHSGIGRKPFAFPPESPFTFSPESLFAFTPESFSRSPRNPFHLPPESALLEGASIQGTPLIGCKNAAQCPQSLRTSFRAAPDRLDVIREQPK